MVTAIPERLVAPLYSFSDADRLAGVSRGTSKRWLAGYTYRMPSGERRESPAIRSPQRGTSEAVSFLDLLEIVAIAGLKERGFSLPEVRRVVSNCQELFDDPYPLSNRDFKVDGRDVFVSRDGRLYDVLQRRGAIAWDEILGPFLETLDYEGSQASRWWPLGRAKAVVVDPAYGYGLPVIHDSGVRTEIIRERIEAGDSIDQVAYDFNVEPRDIEEAIRFELRRAA